MTTQWIVALWLPAVAWTQVQCMGVRSLANFTVSFKTVSDRLGPQQQACGETLVAGNEIRRIIYDSSGKPYFGYSMRITAAGDRQYRAEMGPLKNPPIRSFASFPKPVLVHPDEYIDVPVLERRQTGTRQINYLETLLAWVGLRAPKSPASGGRVTDYFQVVSKGMPWATYPINGWAETPPSGTVLTLDRPHLSNQLRDLGRNNDMGVIGQVVWLYREGLGRFLFSASARPGFRRTAIAEGAVLRFSDERGGSTFDEYTVGVHSNVLPTLGAWIVWMKHEPAFHRPEGPWTTRDLKNGVLGVGVENSSLQGH